MEATTGNGKERVRRWGRVVLKRVDAWKPLYWAWRLIKKAISAHCNSFIQEIWLCWPTIGWWGGGGVGGWGGGGLYSACVAERILGEGYGNHLTKYSFASPTQRSLHSLPLSPSFLLNLGRECAGLGSTPLFSDQSTAWSASWVF